MNGTVLDILIYVFDRYMFDEAPEVPEREALARDLESAGFGEANVERALDWLADLAGERIAPDCSAADGATPRCTSARAAHLFADGAGAAVRGLPRPAAVTGKRRTSSSPPQRELVIDRLLALDVEDLDAGPGHAGWC